MSSVATTGINESIPPRQPDVPKAHLPDVFSRYFSRFSQLPATTVEDHPVALGFRVSPSIRRAEGGSLRYTFNPKRLLPGVPLA